MTTAKFASRVCTHGVRVVALPTFQQKEEGPRGDQYMFSYDIEITNLGKKRIQLLNRKWTIIDAIGHTELVEGPGVIGQNPILFPGETFSYTSFCPLATHWGTMEGSFTMIDEDGEVFPASIARFHLAAPNV